MKQVAGMPADDQLQAVSKKLQELNQGFDGKIGGMWSGPPEVDNGIIRGIGFFTDHVTDISPVLALRGLRQLNCSGMIKGNLSDLRPIQGMQLVSLSVQGNKIEDLTPLTGMRLESLYLSSHGKPIRSLSPLKDMPLTTLNFDSVEDEDLSPLAGMPLVNLLVANVVIEDISVLKGMPLQSLRIPNSRITQDSDLSILRDMPLKELHFDFKPERDADLLRSIKTLEMINGKPAAEFWKEVEEEQKGKKP
jgi:hypothetical protein